MATAIAPAQNRSPAGAGAARSWRTQDPLLERHRSRGKVRRAAERNKENEIRTTVEDKRSRVINFGHSTPPAEVPRAYREPEQALVKHHRVLWYYFGHWGALEFFPEIPRAGINIVSVQGNAESLAANMTSVPMQIGFHLQRSYFLCN